MNDLTAPADGPPPRSHGPEPLTKEERLQIDMFGTVYANYRVDDPLPKAYEIVSMVIAYKGRPERDGYRHLLPHIEAMASDGLNPDQIARSLGMPEELLHDACYAIPEIYHAIMGGKARGVREAAATISRNARNGETAAARFKLQSRGEFYTAKPVQANVQVNIGALEAPVKSDTTDVLKDRQQNIIEAVDYSELG